MVPYMGLFSRPRDVCGDDIAVYKLAAHLVACTHLGIIGGNLVAIPLLIANCQWYFWLPLITLLVSPVIGGTFCMFNRLENYYRNLAGMELIQDRIGHLVKIARGLKWD